MRIRCSAKRKKLIYFFQLHFCIFLFLTFVSSVSPIMTLSLYPLFFAIVSVWSFPDFCSILLPPVQSYCSPLLPATDPFLPVQSVGFQVPFNKVQTTALSACDNKFPLPAKTVHAEQTGRDGKGALNLTAAGLLPCTAASAELRSGLPFVQTTPQVQHGGEWSCEGGCAQPHPLLVHKGKT